MNPGGDRRVELVRLRHFITRDIGPAPERGNMADEPHAAEEQASVLVTWTLKGTIAGVMIVESSPESRLSAALGPYPHAAAAREAIAERRTFMAQAIADLIGKPA